MPRKRKTAAKAAAEAVPTDGTTFQPLDAPSGTELSDKERAEQTTFKPYVKAPTEANDG
jgi:hypothetical protein